MDRNKFYGHKIISQKFLRNAVELIEDIEGDFDIAITDPPAGGDGSDLEHLDDNNLDDEVEMPQEIAGEVDVMYVCEESDENEGIQRAS